VRARRNPPVAAASVQTVGQVRCALLRLLTNAIKDTVSALYWYEELSSSKLAIFGRVLRNFFFVCVSISPSSRRVALAAGEKGEYGTQGSQVIADLSTN
jgi:hypothetical protein